MMSLAPDEFMRVIHIVEIFTANLVVGDSTNTSLFLCYFARWLHYAGIGQTLRLKLCA